MTLKLSVGQKNKKMRDDVGEVCRLVVGWRASKRCQDMVLFNLKQDIRKNNPLGNLEYQQVNK